VFSAGISAPSDLLFMAEKCNCSFSPLAASLSSQEIDLVVLFLQANSISSSRYQVGDTDNPPAWTAVGRGRRAKACQTALFAQKRRVPSSPPCCWPPPARLRRLRRWPWGAARAASGPRPPPCSGAGGRSVGWKVRTGVAGETSKQDRFPLGSVIEQSRGIRQSSRLEETSKIIKSNHQPDTTVPAKPCPEVPHPHGF